MTAAANTFQTNRQVRPMSVGERAELREELEEIPADKRMQTLISWSKAGRITETSVYNSLESYAKSSSDAFARGINLDATKDPVYKDFNEGVYKRAADKYTGDGQLRDRIFKTSYYELFDEVDAEGNRVWDTYSTAKKNQVLSDLMRSIDQSLDGDAFPGLSLRSSNVLTPELDENGNPLMINGNIVFKEGRVN